uniref:Uncharacterized protein n=1 Tax=Arundo donax TaxID=35708 RepID=A0A0A8ZKY6_ARUDO
MRSLTDVRRKPNHQRTIACHGGRDPALSTGCKAL